MKPFVLGVLGVLGVLPPLAAPLYAQPPAAEPALPTYTREDLERRALEHNPALAQAEAAIQAADARARQAGLWPDPVVGYTAEDVPLEDRPGDSGKHGLFIAQEIPLGGKLRLAREVLAQDLAQTRARAEAQRLRLLGEIRSLHARTLAAQLRVETRERLAALTREAVDVTAQLFNTGAADATDQLAIQNEAALAEADLSAARVELDQLWAVLRSAVADPSLEPGRLEGDLATTLPDLDRAEWRDKILKSSPEVAIARAELARAEAALSRARLESERVRLALDSRYAAAYAQYRQAAERVRTYREGVLDRARKAYEQYFAQYQQMQAAYPQVLIAQRTLIQLEEDYARTLARAWEAAVSIESLLASSAGMETTPTGGGAVELSH